VLWSPWTDVTVSGDSYYRLNNTDPFLPSALLLVNMSQAYTNPQIRKILYVSPVYGNFSKGFLPTLIQGGTSEFMLSDFVRLYQAIDQVDIQLNWIYTKECHMISKYSCTIHQKLIQLFLK
jgi:epsilon-lactone hydrolase